jgi:hypothetical protein
LKGNVSPLFGVWRSLLDFWQAGDLSYRQITNRWLSCKRQRPRITGCWDGHSPSKSSHSR